jgi:hypothetical protein
MDFNLFQEKHSQIFMKITKLKNEKDDKIASILLEYTSKIQLLENELKPILNEYLDSVLFDMYGKTVKEGSYLTDRHNNIYQVEKRCVQFVFQTLMRDPHVEVLMLDKQLTPVNGRIWCLTRYELISDFKIIDIEQQRNHLKD